MHDLRASIECLCSGCVCLGKRTWRQLEVCDLKSVKAFIKSRSDISKQFHHLCEICYEINLKLKHSAFRVREHNVFAGSIADMCEHSCSCASLLKYNFINDSNLVDPASSHTLVSKIKPCMSKYKQSIL